MYYKHLKTKSFKKNIKKQNITSTDLIYYLQLVYSTAAFSTFPYLINKENSKQALKHNCGNCVSLSLIIQKLLKDEKKIKSYLIPATIPEHIYRPGYLDISHVVLAIPYSKNGIFIVDPAFYFIEPIDIDIRKLPHNNEPILKSKIYSHTTVLINSRTSILDKKLKLNKFQTIPAKTIACECIDDDNEPWSYFLTEILNPDEAISTFFINIRKEPFITTTEIDDEGICQQNIDLRVKDDNTITISLKNNKIYDGLISDISQDVYNILNEQLGQHFDGDISNYLTAPIRGPYTFK